MKAQTATAPVFEKLNLGRHREIVVLNAPPSFEAALAELQGVRVLRDAARLKAIHFVLAFATTAKEVDALCDELIEKAPGDAVVWVAYPKGSSKRYQSALNRDNGWGALRAAGFDTVRVVAIDEDWSALRFRRIEHIGSRANSALPR